MALLPHQACDFCISSNADRIALILNILKEIRLVLVWNIGLSSPVTGVFDGVHCWLAQIG